MTGKAVALAVALAIGLVPAAAAARHRVVPLTTVKAPGFGTIVATRRHLALYTWNRERDGKIRCTGDCARAWPPLLVAKDAVVPARVAGVAGRLGTTVRPDGRVQVTLAGRPLYTYRDDTPTRILCDGVDGWTVVHA
jgi:predicted lipoprotein with Yx(FWY)xxD motif